MLLIIDCVILGFCFAQRGHGSLAYRDNGAFAVVLDFDIDKDECNVSVIVPQYVSYRLDLFLEMAL